MSDELLRYLGSNSGKLRRTKFIKHSTGKQHERIEGGVWLCLLNAMCFHANHFDRQCFAGIKKLAKEAGCNIDTVYEWTEFFEHLGWLTPQAPRRADNSHKKAKCWEITFPHLLPLDYWQKQQEAEELEREVNAERRRLAKIEAKKVPVEVPVEVPLNNPGSVDEQGLDDEVVREHKVKHKPPLKIQTGGLEKNNETSALLLEQVMKLYAEHTLKKTRNVVTNKESWCKKVILKASEIITDRGDTYVQRAQSLIDQGEKVENIAAYLADGCKHGQSITFWDKRPGFFDESDVSKIGPVNFGQTADDSDVPF